MCTHENADVIGLWKCTCNQEIVSLYIFLWLVQHSDYWDSVNKVIAIFCPRCFCLENVLRSVDETVEPDTRSMPCTVDIEQFSDANVKAQHQSLGKKLNEILDI